MSTALGNHILVEFMNCDPHIMNDVAAIERDMVAAAQKAGATVINSTFSATTLNVIFLFQLFFQIIVCIRPFNCS